MLESQQRFSINDKQVAAKMVDGEAILINLSSGLYYSMGTVAALIWRLLEQRHSIEEIAGVVSEQYGISVEQATADVEHLSTELLSEDLISISQDTSSSAPKDGKTAEFNGSAYESPVLNKFSDMADMFALDPPLPGLAESDNKTGV